MPFSILYKAYTKDPKSVCGNPIKCQANWGCKLLIIMLIWSISDGLSMTYEIFFLQRGINEVTDSSGLCLNAFNSLLDTSMTVLNAWCLKNSWARSSQVQTAWYIQWSKPMLCRTTQGHGEKHNHLSLVQSMSPHDRTVKPQMDAGASNSCVSLDLWYPKLGR